MNDKITEAVIALDGIYPGTHDDLYYHTCAVDGGYYVAGEDCRTCAQCEYVCSREQFDAEVERLRNKPSFADHPDAKCFVQNDDGGWHKHTGTSNVKAFDDGGWRAQRIPNGGQFQYVQTGTVLGSWRDTLEERPVEPKKTPAQEMGLEIGSRAIVNQVGRPISKGSEVELFEDDGTDAPMFRLISGDCSFTHADGEPGAYCNLTALSFIDKQDQSPDDQPQWRGPEDGLPPVGTVCEYYWYEGARWRRGEVAAHNRGRAVMVDEHDDSAELCTPQDLRPIPTDRERWAIDACEQIESTVDKYNVDVRCSAAIRATVEAIRDALLNGSLPVPGGSEGGDTVFDSAKHRTDQWSKSKKESLERGVNGKF